MTASADICSAMSSFVPQRVASNYWCPEILP